MAALIRRRAEAFRASRIHAPHQVAALRASGAQIDLTNPRDVSSITRYRQPWQEQSLDYLEAVGELRYAVELLANIIKKVGIYPATYTPTEDAPVRMDEGDDKRYAPTAQEALDRLGNAGAVGELAAATIAAFKAPGEACLVGRVDNGGGVAREVWEIRSISEVGTTGGKVVIRDAPSGRTLAGRPWQDAEPLPPDSVVARLWIPSRRWRMLADSPVRVAIETCLEELVLLSKDVRSGATSRIATNGVFAYPDSWSVVRAGDGPEDTGSGQDDPFMATLIEAGTEAMRDPGSAAAALPILIRAPLDSVDKAHHYTFARPESDNAAKRAEALGRLATTLDLPAELLTGVGSKANHWSAFLLDDLKWRDHGEPAAQALVGSWTSAFLHPYLVAAGVPADVIARTTFWFDPTNAIVKSDRSQAAMDAHDRVEISGEAYRKYMDFAEDDAPGEEERLVRAALKGVLDPPSALAVLMGREPPDPASSAVPPGEPGEVEPPVDDGEVDAPNGGEPPAQDPAEKGKPGLSASAMRLVIAARRPPPALVAAPAPDRRAATISARLTEIDRRLRGDIRMAAEAAVRRALEKTGAREYSKVKTRNPAIAAALHEVPIWQVSHQVRTLPPALVAALGLDEHEKVAVELAALAALWERFVAHGQSRALREAAALVGADAAVALVRLESTFAANRMAGWAFLSAQLERRAQDALARDVSADVEASSLVPTGIVRSALAIAGGYDGPESQGVDADTGRPVDPSQEFGQIGTGATIGQFLRDGGAQVVTYQWVHGFALNPFEPHEDLDGQQFTTWGDSALAAGDFVGTAYYPGDHDGCFVAETPVSVSGLLATTERSYTGELVSIRFASGKHFRCTPNHPILTRSGWVAAGKLNQGSDVVGCLDPKRVSSLVNPDADQYESTIEQITRSFDVLTLSVPSAPEDFHGDRGDADVYVVRTHGDLRDRRVAALDHPFGESALTVGVELAPLLPGPGALFEISEGGLAPDGFVSSPSPRDLPLAGHLAIDEPSGFGRSASRVAGPVEPISDCAPTHANLFGDGVVRVASKEQFDELIVSQVGSLESDSPGRGFLYIDTVVSARTECFSGQVFNLHTNTGWYVANGIIAHNCSCDVIQMWSPPGDTSDADE